MDDILIRLECLKLAEDLYNKRGGSDSQILVTAKMFEDWVKTGSLDTEK